MTDFISSVGGDINTRVFHELCGILSISYDDCIPYE